MEGKKYFSIHGPDLGNKLPWKLGISTYTEDKFFKGNYGVTVGDSKLTYFKTLSELLDYAKAKGIYE